MKITTIEPIVLESPLANASPAGSEEAAGVKYLLLVKITTDEGIVGWSDIETAPHIGRAVLTAPESGAGMIDGLQHVYLGRNPFHVEQLWHEAYRASAYYGRRGVAIQVMSGLDIALHDIIGKATGRPVCEHLGAVYHRRVRAYASTLFRPTPEAMSEACHAYLEQGFTAVKFGWGCFGADRRTDLALVRAARESLGPEPVLLVDPGWTRQRTAFEAISLMHDLEEFDVYWLEDFLHPEDHAGYARVRQANSGIRVAAGEQEATGWGFHQLMAAGAVDVVQPDLSRCGGFTHFRRICWEAEKASVDVCPHAWMTDLLTAASLHANAFLPRSLFLEFNTAMSPMLHDIIADPMALDTDGHLPVPDGPGLGVLINEDAVEHYRVD